MDNSWKLRTLLHSPTFLHLLLILCLLTVLYGYYFWSLRVAKKRADAWTLELTPTKIQLDDNSLLSFKTGSIEEQSRLRGQFRAVNNYLQWHLYIAKQYYGFAYGATAAAYTAAGIAAIALFWITKEGVAAANRYLITTFVVSTVMAISFQTFTVTGKHKENIDANVAAYIQYVNLGNRIISFAVTGEDQSGKPVAPSEFIHRVDAEMSTLNSVSIGYEPSKIPQYKTDVK